MTEPYQLLDDVLYLGRVLSTEPKSLFQNFVALPKLDDPRPPRYLQYMYSYYVATGVASRA